METFTCNEHHYQILTICILNIDILIIIINLITIFLILTWTFINKNLKNKSIPKTINVKGNFCLLGEGALSCFYTNENNLKVNSKVKKSSKNVSQSSGDRHEKNNSELKCNICGRKVELSYSNTLSKLVQA